jgi:hypothetical protein
MRAIETIYRGWKFRSRLEARYAVFFDALSIKWEYEPEGFEFADGTRYLPDFYLPKFHGGIYVEVKPDDDPCEKARRFAEEAVQNTLLAQGTPTSGIYTLLQWEETGLIPRPVGFCAKYLPGGSNQTEYRLYWYPESSDPNDWGIVPAVVAARSARFEFGAQRHLPV